MAIHEKLKDLSGVFEDYYMGRISDGVRDLLIDMAGYVHMETDQIPWTQIRHLALSNLASTDHNPEYPPNAYVNLQEGCMFLLFPEAEGIQELLRCRGENLESLAIRRFMIDSLPLLDSLTTLTTLDISFCLITELPPLDLLTNLTTLKLSYCPNITKLPALDNLTKLTTLNIAYCYSIAEFPSLEMQKELTTLELFDSHSLKVLQSLDKLTELTTLNLASCPNLSVLPPLNCLTKLTELDISACVNLAELPPLNKLTQLKALRLSYCDGLKELPPLDCQTKLTILDISGCPCIAELPDTIRSMKELRYLNLSDLRLQTLPDWLPEIAERFSLDPLDKGSGEHRAVVDLGDTIVEDMNMSIFEQPFEVVAEFFANRKKGNVQTLNEIKVVFLGDGEAGKSHTIARLMNDGGAPEGYVDVRTPGIVIKDLHQLVGGRDITLHLWDFGGQDIMHSMHRIFLTERTLYVVLVDGSIGNQDERARYWLQNIQSFAKDAPVLLVLNKLDDNLQADVNAVNLTDKYKGLKRILKLSALQYSKERFNREFRDALLEEVAKTGYLDVQWPKAWAQVKNELEQMKSNYIHGEDYLRICDEFCVDNNQKDLLKWFHDLGISFCYCDGEYEAMEDYVVLKPNWITNALYIILFNEREDGNGGLVPIHTIRTMLGRNAPNMEAIKRVIPGAYYNGYDVNYVLDVFHAFRLSFQTDEHHEFFPMLADVNAKPVAKEYAEDATCLEFNMEFDYLPNNLLHRLMVERQTEMDMDNVWRTGARFELKELGLSAVVVIDGNTLKFFIRHKNENHRPNIYLTMLKASVDRIVKSMGLKAPTNILTYKVYGKSVKFSYDRLLKMSAKGRKMEFCEDLEEDFLIQDILNQSAPDDQVEEHKLLKTILQVCEQIQREPECWGTKEDVRNRRMRDALEIAKYDVHDQTQLGISSSKKDVGELDLMIYRGNQVPWSIIEALRIYNGSKGDWNTHLEKVLDNYNPHGVPFLFLVTYADCEKKHFDGIWKGYENHIQNHHSGEFTYVDQSYELLTGLLNNHYLQIAKSRYRCGDYTPTVYHIFVQMNPKQEITLE